MDRKVQVGVVKNSVRRRAAMTIVVRNRADRKRVADRKVVVRWVRRRRAMVSVEVPKLAGVARRPGVPQPIVVQKDVGLRLVRRAMENVVVRWARRREMANNAVLKLAVAARRREVPKPIVARRDAVRKHEVPKGAARWVRRRVTENVVDLKLAVVQVRVVAADRLRDRKVAGVMAVPFLHRRVMMM